MAKRGRPKKKFDIQGNMTQKVCLVIQVVLLFLSLGATVYCNVAEVTEGFIASIPTYALYVVIALGLFPAFFEVNRRKR